MSKYLDRLYLRIAKYYEENAYLINILLIATVAAYGFELFNLNLTIDEEIHAFFNGPTSDWIAQGRWGMYVLNRFLLPYTIVPVVPLLLALILHLISVLLLLDAWGVKPKLDRVVLGILGITFPTMAYAYTFSTFNFGIGFGLLCVALTIYIYSSSTDWTRFFAIAPAMFSLAIYQGFIPALISVFLVSIISSIMSSKKSVLKDIAYSSFIIVCAMIAYYVTQKLMIFLFQLPASGYISQYLDINYLLNDFQSVFSNTFRSAMDVYMGDAEIYSINIPMLGVLFLTFLGGIIWHLFLSKTAITTKIITIFLIACLILLPFSLGILSRGIIGMRVAVALPMVVMGLGMLGMSINESFFKLTIAVITGFCFLQFIVSTNHLFASSYLSLQIDRLMASQLIDEIQEAKNTSKINNPKYLAIVGQVNRPPTELMPKADTFGASFFEWDGGNVGRVVLFLKTIGYSELEFLPFNRAAEFVQTAESMPNWPGKGSVRVVKDTVIVKLSDYTYPQILGICNSETNIATLPQGFCP